MSILKRHMTFIKYILSATCSFLLDISLFTLLSFLLKDSIGSKAIFIATVVARIVSSFVNYLLNRNQVFKSNNKKMDSKTLVKYYILVIIQMFVSATVVYFMYEATKIHESFIKVPVEFFLFLVNYVVQREFIFNENPRKINWKKYHLLCSIAFAVCTTFSFLFQVPASKNLLFARHNTMVLTYLFVIVSLIFFYRKYLNKFVNRISYHVIAIMFSLFMIFGYSYDIVGSANLVFGNISLMFFSIVKFTGFYSFFVTLLHLLDDIIVTKKLKDIKIAKKLFILFHTHTFLFSFIVILLCYLPYIIAYYPVLLNPDAVNQIKEVMGIHTRYMDSVILLNPNVTLTNFNPVIHTLLLGGLFRFGHVIGDVNIGLFLYSIVQLVIVIGVFAYTIAYLKKEKVNNILLFISLGIFALVPLFPFYAMTGVKDVIFSSLFLLYVIRLYDTYKYSQTKKNYFFLFLISLLLVLFRNNGILTLLVSMPFLMLNKHIRRPIFIVFVATLMMYFGYNKILLPHFEIANTSVREILSIPFQQTARHVKYYGEEISLKDREVIDKILTYDTLAERYVPDLSDAVKNRYNKYASHEDLMKYFKVWFKYLLKRPVVYIDATINNVYGYVYPNTSSWYIYTNLNKQLAEAGFDYHFNELSGLRIMLKSFGNNFPYLPIIGGIANIGFLVWAHIFLVAFLSIHKMKKHMLLILPSLSIIFICLVGPANTYFRYMLPCVFVLPFICCILYKELKS